MLSQRKYFGILLVVFAAVFFLLCSNQALADAKFNRTVTVTCNPLKAPDFEKCVAGEKLTIVNACTLSIAVSYNGAAQWDTIPKNLSKDYNCTNDQDCYTVTVPGMFGKIESSTGCSPGGGGSEALPTLTQWGIIILVGLIIVTGVYLWIRRKPVTT